MNRNQQFELLWEAKCKHGILAMIKTKKGHLSRKDLQRELRYSIRRGMVSHTFTLCTIAGFKLPPNQSDRLVNRCLDLQRVPEALRAIRQGAVLKKHTKERMTNAVIGIGLTVTLEKALELLAAPR